MYGEETVDKYLSTIVIITSFHNSVSVERLGSERQILLFSFNCTDEIIKLKNKLTGIY